MAAPLLPLLLQAAPMILSMFGNKGDSKEQEQAQPSMSENIVQRTSGGQPTPLVDTSSPDLTGTLFPQMGGGMAQSPGIAQLLKLLGQGR